MAKEIKGEQEARLNDDAYRNSLTPEQLAKSPAKPADESELSEEELDDINGGNIFGDVARYIAKKLRK